MFDLAAPPRQRLGETVPGPCPASSSAIGPTAWIRRRSAGPDQMSTGRLARDEEAEIVAWLNDVVKLLSRDIFDGTSPPSTETSASLTRSFTSCPDSPGPWGRKARPTLSVTAPLSPQGEP